MGIRAIETEKYAVVDIASNKILEEIEESKAFFTVPIFSHFNHRNFRSPMLVCSIDLLMLRSMMEVFISIKGTPT